MGNVPPELLAVFEEMAETLSLLTGKSYAVVIELGQVDNVTCPLIQIVPVPARIEEFVKQKFEENGQSLN